MLEGSGPGGRRHAVVLPGGHPRGMAVIRSMGRAGIPVTVVDVWARSQAFHSRYATAKHLVDGDDEAGQLELLEAIGRRAGGVLFPTDDLRLRLVARHAERLGRHFALAAPPWPALEVLMDRVRAYAAAREAGLRPVRAWAPRDAAELEAVLGELDFDRWDYVLKANVWDAPADPRTRRYTRVAGPDADTLRARWREIAARAQCPPTLEEVVPGGSERCIGATLVMGGDGAVHLAYAVRRLKLHAYTRGGRFAHPYELGSNVFCEPTRDDEAVEQAVALARHVGYVGTVTVEFRRDPVDGGLTFLKADPRPVRSTALSAAIGLDVPAALWRVATGAPPVPARPCREGVAWLWVVAWWNALRANPGGRPAGRELRALARALPRVRAFAYLDRRDPRPFLRTLLPLLPRPARRRLRPWLLRRADRVPVLPADGGAVS